MDAMCYSSHLQKYKRLFSGSSEKDMNVTLDMFWTEYTDFDNKIGSFLINLFGKAKTLVMATVICGIKNIHSLSPRFLVLLNVESHQRFLVLLQQSVLGVTQRQLNLGKDLPLELMYQRNTVLFIHPPVLNLLGFNNTKNTNNFMIIYQAIPGMKRMMHLITSWMNGVWIEYFQNRQNLLKESLELT